MNAAASSAARLLARVFGRCATAWRRAHEDFPTIAVLAVGTGAVLDNEEVVRTGAVVECVTVDSETVLLEDYTMTTCSTVIGLDSAVCAGANRSRHGSREYFGGMLRVFNWRR